MERFFRALMMIKVGVAMKVNDTSGWSQCWSLQAAEKKYVN